MSTTAEEALDHYEDALQISKSKRYCIRCANPRRLEAFNYRGKRETEINPNHTVCLVCYRKERQELKSKKIAEKKSRLFDRLGIAIQKDRLDEPTASELATGMVNQFNNLQGFCAAWKEQIDHAILAKPGSRTVLQAFKDISNLVMVASQQRISSTPMGELSDFALDEQLQIMLLTAMRDDPRIMIDMIQEHPELRQLLQSTIVLNESEYQQTEAPADSKEESDDGAE